MAEWTREELEQAIRTWNDRLHQLRDKSLSGGLTDGERDEENVLRERLKNANEELNRRFGRGIKRSGEDDVTMGDVSV